uniref:Uncharacterized protein n=1 Tax=Siphoviridae sp. ctNHg2 TaxID=2825467 RepID=A0A8S5V4L3_9CAUD|nr:MAG TPA: hypothetical protein [Siphoviridae sp. ctNHg2]DAP49893.1 MAG TPA: hypothetical protein [Caudoviricetes sp.]DAT01391.1 MAG TPA: hypothetical protein [Caudoviricetes sp.]
MVSSVYRIFYRKVKKKLTLQRVSLFYVRTENAIQDLARQ